MPDNVVRIDPIDAPFPRGAAFFRLERVLIGQKWVDPTLTAAGWMAAGQQQVSSRLARLGTVAAAGLLAAPTPAQDRTTAVRMAWLALRGASEDRLVVLGEEYAHKLIESLDETGLRMLSDARHRGLRIVLLTELLDVIAEHMAEHMGVDLLVCNRMELRNDRATGKLDGPVFAGVFGGDRCRAFATEHRIDLGASSAWGGCATDGVLLSSVGDPCAVHPDASLRRLARDLHWPVVEGA